MSNNQQSLTDVIEETREDDSETEPSAPTPDGFPDRIAEAGDATLRHDREAPPSCLSFTVSAPFAHFRKVETSQTRLTYSVPPRTTVSGLIAAILGFDKNSYYQLFQPLHSAISIQVVNPIRKMNMMVNHTTVQPKDMTSAGDALEIDTVDDGPHQRVNHSTIRDASYRVDVWLSNEEVYEGLEAFLESGKTYYTPALGVSEHLADVEYHGKFTPEPVDGATPTTVNSIVPSDAGEVHHPDGATVVTERSPAVMERIENPLPNRETTEFMSHYFREDAGHLEVESDHIVTVDGRNVIFS